MSTSVLYVFNHKNYCYYMLIVFWTRRLLQDSGLEKVRLYRLGIRIRLKSVIRHILKYVQLVRVVIVGIFLQNRANFDVFECFWIFDRNLLIGFSTKYYFRRVINTTRSRRVKFVKALFIQYSFRDQYRIEFRSRYSWRLYLYVPNRTVVIVIIIYVFFFHTVS